MGLCSGVFCSQVKLLHTSHKHVYDTQSCLSISSDVADPSPCRLNSEHPFLSQLPSHHQQAVLGTSDGESDQFSTSSSSPVMLDSGSPTELLPTASHFPWLPPSSHHLPAHQHPFSGMFTHTNTLTLFVQVLNIYFLVSAAGPVLDFGVPMLDPLSHHHHHHLGASGSGPSDRMCYPSHEQGPNPDHMARFSAAQQSGRSMPTCIGGPANKTTFMHSSECVCS